VARFERIEDDANVFVGPINHPKLMLKPCTREWAVEAWIRYTGPWGGFARLNETYAHICGSSEEGYYLSHIGVRAGFQFRLDGGNTPESGCGLLPTIRYEGNFAGRDPNHDVHFASKLAALVPPPRLNLIRYHGILAPSARDRARIVPGGEDEPEAPSDSTHQVCPHRLSWCQLLARVFSIDVTECPDCGGQMKIIAALTDRASIRSYLEGVGLPARPPPIAQARPTQQSEFEYAA
jgi:hypothetical protein